MKTEVQNRSEMRLFENETFGKIRTILRDGDPWFVAKDVCDILGTTNPTMALSSLESFERSKFNLGRQGETNIISESGFYTLVLRSRKPIAKPFRVWVTSEVLPTIRKTGKYVSQTDGEFYKKLDELENKFSLTVVQLNNVENALDTQTEKFIAVMDNMTITTVQQGELQRAVKARVSALLGAAHSEQYKEYSRMYFINLWNNIKETFSCGSRWQDLNPKYFHRALDFISEWEYIER